MTLVKSRIVGPSGSPRPGVLVTGTIIAAPHWTSDATGVVVGETRARTGRDGWWRLSLLDYMQIEGYAYALLTEHSGQTARHHHTCWLRVPPAPGELLMRDLVVPPPDQPQAWKPMPTVGALRGMDPAVDRAPDGQVMLRTDGRWSHAAVPATALARLTDVHPSIGTARPGEALVFLGTGIGWGVPREPPPTGLRYTTSDPGPQVDPDGYTLQLDLLTRAQGRPVTVDWGDTTTVELPPDVSQARYQYPAAPPQNYALWVSYADGDKEPGEPDGQGDDYPLIPFPR